jgi:hypothetical protein
MNLRLQDVLFGLVGLAVGVLLAFHFDVIVTALLGAFMCGSVYVFAGMVPSREDAFWRRAFTTVFLSLVLSSLVLILPATTGSPELLRPAVKTVVLAIAGALPLMAFCFEVLRTPQITRGILWCLGYR